MAHPLQMDKKTFGYLPATDDQQKKLDNLNAVFNATLEVIETLVPEGRYRSIAITELEKAGAMAVKGLFKKSDGSPINSDTAQSTSGWKPRPDIEHIASLCHEANRAYCESLGDTSQLPWNAAPEWQRTSCINGVKFHIENPAASPSASHDAWLLEKERDGWKYGSVKDVEKKEHPCFLPYDQLPQEQRAKDYIFSAIVRQALAKTEKA